MNRISDRSSEVVARVRLFSCFVWRYYARLLRWSRARSLFGQASVSARGHRVFRLPVHSVALVGAHLRCVRCLRRQQDLAQQSVCVPASLAPHTLCSWSETPEAIFCRVCGAYSFSKTRGLARGCAGEPAQPSVLKWMLSGRHPDRRKKAWLGHVDSCCMHACLVPLGTLPAGSAGENLLGPNSWRVNLR